MTLRRAHLAAALCAVALVTGPDPVRAEATSPLRSLPPAPAAASGASGTLDPVAATRAYLDELSGAKKAQSDAYFEGGYWLQLWGFLWGSAIYLLLLFTGLSSRMRALAERVHWRALQPAAYWLQFLAATTLLGLPLSVYQDWWRERQYGLSNLTLGGWLGEQGKGLLVSALLGGLAVMGFYAVLRRAGRTWWLWGALVSLAFSVIGSVIAPVAITPIFNSPTRLTDQRVVAPILSLARANGISTGEVWEIDASKQTTRVSANVSGLLGTERITLNDNLLNRSSQPEIEAVMAHEMGHYVLNHVYKGQLEVGVVILLGFWVVSGFFERLRDRFAARWGVTGIADPAGLPLVALLFGAFMFVMTPALNTLVRVAEQEADYYGLNAARQPDGFARVALELSSYRKLEPTPFEEAIFYDHPSGRTRIITAMRWKAEHPDTWSAAAQPAVSPAAPARPERGSHDPRPARADAAGGSPGAP
jgi:STE24 endopeptidase